MGFSLACSRRLTREILVESRNKVRPSWRVSVRFGGFLEPDISCWWLGAILQ